MAHLCAQDPGSPGALTPAYNFGVNRALWVLSHRDLFAYCPIENPNGDGHGLSGIRDLYQNAE